MPNIMELPPPMRSCIFFDIYCPSIQKMAIGSTQLKIKLTIGEVCSTIRLEKVTPASCRRSVRSGSSIRPVW